MDTKFWARYNNTNYRYETVLNINPEWDLVVSEAMTSDGINEAALFHRGCAPNPKEFADSFDKVLPPYPAIGAIDEEGCCDVCGAEGVEQRFIDIGKFTYGDTFMYGCNEPEKVEDDSL